MRPQCGSPPSPLPSVDAVVSVTHPRPGPGMLQVACLACIFNGDVGIGLLWCCLAALRVAICWPRQSHVHIGRKLDALNRRRKRPVFSNWSHWGFSCIFSAHCPPRRHRQWAWLGGFREAVRPYRQKPQIRIFVSSFRFFLTPPLYAPRSRTTAHDTPIRTSVFSNTQILSPLPYFPPLRQIQNVHAARCSDGRSPGGCCPRRPPRLYDLVHPPYVLPRGRKPREMLQEDQFFGGLSRNG